MGGGGMESMTLPSSNVGGGSSCATANGIQQKVKEGCGGGYFQMPLHYPRYRPLEYETMPEWKLDCLLTQYGLPVVGDIQQKRKFAMGAFLWSY